MIVDGTRELAYVVKIDDIQPIVGSDNCECAVVGGWRVMVKKNEFKPGDLAVYFEIDSKLDPSNPAFAFLEKKHYAVKTQKYTFGGKGLMISQGLLMTCAELGVDGKPEGTPLTKDLNITYYIAEDNARKSGSNSNKYQSMSARHNKLAKTKLWRWLMRKKWGRKILYFFFGKKRLDVKSFPKHFPYIHITDEERCENIPWVLENKDPWIKTTKIDGTSSTYILERKPFGYEYYVCSRNVRQLTPNQATYHDSNVYWEMSDKYHIKEFLEAQLRKHKDWKYVCLQGETAGVALQGNPHNFPDVRFFGFNFIDSVNGRWNSLQARALCDLYNIPWVPIVDSNYILPDDFEEFKLSADGPCEAPDATGLREGYVYRSLDGVNSFKNVSREYLLHKGE